MKRSNSGFSETNKIPITALDESRQTPPNSIRLNKKDTEIMVDPYDYGRSLNITSDLVNRTDNSPRVG